MAYRASSSARIAVRSLLAAEGRALAVAQRWSGAMNGSPSTVGNTRTLASAASDPLYAPDYPSRLPIPSSSLAALLARLGLPATKEMQDALLVALTDVSYDPTKLPPSIRSDVEAAQPLPVENNTLLSSLGNAMLGLYASEHLATTYPNLPTRALKALVSLHVGPNACFDVAKSLGVGVANGPYDTDGTLRAEGNAGKSRKRSTASAGVPVRWVRGEREVREDGDAREGKRRTTWEEVVARSVRSFVGLIYQEKGIAAARKFVHAHFMSRHVDVASTLNFRNPKHVLSVEVRKLLGQAGAPEMAGVQSRILAESGRHSLSPIYNIGLFLPSGLKLAEGYGSSLRMAEHRAALNALTSIYTARGELLVRDHEKSQGAEQVGMQLPTEVYAPPPESSQMGTTTAPADSVLRPNPTKELGFRGNVLLSRAEALVGSGEDGMDRKMRSGRR